MLELNNISYSAESEKGGEKEIIKELSLRVEDGKFLAITGPNGGGKSTTAKLIMASRSLTQAALFLTARTSPICP